MGIGITAVKQVYMLVRVRKWQSLALVVKAKKLSDENQREESGLSMMCVCVRVRERGVGVGGRVYQHLKKFF